VVVLADVVVMNGVEKVADVGAQRGKLPRAGVRPAGSQLFGRIRQSVQFEADSFVHQQIGGRLGHRGSPGSSNLGIRA
jgi:hypothetical protein